jgi:putative redox protein
VGKVKVDWARDMTFVGSDSNNHSVVLSTPGDGVGMKPSELLLISLASCTAVDVVSILTKKRAKLTGLRVSVDAEQANHGWPRPYTSFHIHYEAIGVGLKPAEVEKAITLSEEKYCSISATLKQSGEVTFDFEIIEADL